MVAPYLDLRHRASREIAPGPELDTALAGRATIRVMAIARSWRASGEACYRGHNSRSCTAALRVGRLSAQHGAAFRGDAVRCARQPASGPQALPHPAAGIPRPAEAFPVSGVSTAEWKRPRHRLSAKIPSCPLLFDPSPSPALGSIGKVKAAIRTARTFYRSIRGNSSTHGHRRRNGLSVERKPGRSAI